MPQRARLNPMRPRDPHEPGRVASSLELFFDLVFVIAVGIAASELHEQLQDGPVWPAVGHYLMAFFAIWWAWMNFTWFATSFDTDDWLYRLLTIAQMGGVLVLAAGLEPAAVNGDFRLMIYAYVLMRVCLVAQWLRASRSSGHHARGAEPTPAQTAARAYAVGIAVVQILWLAALLLPRPVFLPAVVVLILAEVFVPVVAERRGRTPWHPHHITERYGAFTLIVLGESLLASAIAILHARGEAESLVPLIETGVLAFVGVAALWWIYFWPPHHRAIGQLRNSLLYGYGHYVVFAAAAAFSVGIEVQVDVVTGEGRLSGVAAGFVYAIPVAVFLLAVWVLAIRRSADRVVNVGLPLAAVLVLMDPLLPLPVALTAVILAAAVALLVWRSPVGEGA